MEGLITAPWDEGSLQRDRDGRAVSLVRGERLFWAGENGVQSTAMIIRRDHTAGITRLGQIRTFQRELQQHIRVQQREWEQVGSTWLSSSGCVLKGFVWRTSSASNIWKYGSSSKSSKRGYLIFCKQNALLWIFVSSKFHFILLSVSVFMA